MEFKKILSIGLIVAFLFLGIPKLQADDTSDLILKLLIKKGLITQKEVDELKSEVAKIKPAVPKDLEGRVAKLEGNQFELPGWAKGMKFNADLRLRYQYSDRTDSAESGDHLGRFRFRMGAKTKINDKVKAAVGIATEADGGDHDSRNITFGQTFEGKSIRLDHAYVTYNPQDWVSIFGGKMKRKEILWMVSDMLWDGDTTPEGGAVVLSKELDKIKLFSNQGYFIVEDDGQGDWPYIAYVQPGVEIKAGDAKLKVAATYFDIYSKGETTDHGNNGNTMRGGLFRYNYDSINPLAELSIKNPLGGLVPFAAIFGQYVQAFDADTRNEAYSAGLKFGDKKVKKPGSWQFKYMYNYKEADSWWDPFGDGDLYSGDTNVKGHEWVFQYGLAKNIILGLDAYLTKPIETINSMTATNKEFVVQSDLIFKF